MFRKSDGPLANLVVRIEKEAFWRVDGSAQSAS